MGKTIVKKVADVLEISSHDTTNEKVKKRLSKSQKEQLILELEKEMKAAAKALEFEKAAYLRDQIQKLQLKK